MDSLPKAFNCRLSSFFPAEWFASVTNSNRPCTFFYYTWYLEKVKSCGNNILYSGFILSGLWPCIAGKLILWYSLTSHQTWVTNSTIDQTSNLQCYIHVRSVLCSNFGVKPGCSGLGEEYKARVLYHHGKGFYILSASEWEVSVICWMQGHSPC